MARREKFFLLPEAHNCGIDVLELLLKGGADLNARTKWGDNALHYAARRGSAEVMRFLIAKGIETWKPEGRQTTTSPKLFKIISFVDEMGFV